MKAQCRSTWKAWARQCAFQALLLYIAKSSSSSCQPYIARVWLSCSRLPPTVRPSDRRPLDMQLVNITYIKALGSVGASTWCESVGIIHYLLHRKSWIRIQFSIRKCIAFSDVRHVEEKQNSILKRMDIYIHIYIYDQPPAAMGTPNGIPPLTMRTSELLQYAFRGLYARLHDSWCRSVAPWPDLIHQKIDTEPHWLIAHAWTLKHSQVT